MRRRFESTHTLRFKLLGHPFVLVELAERPPGSRPPVCCCKPPPPCRRRHFAPGVSQSGLVSFPFREKLLEDPLCNLVVLESLAVFFQRLANLIVRLNQGLVVGSWQ